MEKVFMEAYYKQMHPDKKLPECYFCGKEKTDGAYWNGMGGNIFLCYECIKEGSILGCLVGDGMASVGITKYADVHKELEDILEKIEKNALYAILCELTERKKN